MYVMCSGCHRLPICQRSSVTSAMLCDQTVNWSGNVVRNQCQQLRRGLRGLEREGIRYVFKLSSSEES